MFCFHTRCLRRLPSTFFIYIPKSNQIIKGTNKRPPAYLFIRYVMNCFYDALRRSATLRYARLRFATLRCARLRYATLRDATFCYALLRYAALCHASPACALLRYAVMRSDAPRFAPPCYAALRYAVLRYTARATLHDAVLRYAMLCYAALSCATLLLCYAPVRAAGPRYNVSFRSPGPTRIHHIVPNGEDTFYLNIPN